MAKKATGEEPGRQEPNKCEHGIILTEPCDKCVAELRRITEMEQGGKLVELDQARPLANISPNFLKMVRGTKALLNGADKVQLFNLLQFTDDDLADIKEEQFGAQGFPAWELTKWIAWPGSMVDPQTGEVKQVTRVALVLADGRTIGTASEGIFHSLMEAEILWPHSPWQPPLKCRLRVKRAKVGQLYKLEMLP